MLLSQKPKKLWSLLWMIFCSTILTNCIILYQFDKKNQRDRFTGCLNKIEQNMFLSSIHHRFIALKPNLKFYLELHSKPARSNVKI